jgi:hypothetical protein
LWLPPRERLAILKETAGPAVVRQVAAHTMAAAPSLANEEHRHPPIAVAAASVRVKALRAAAKRALNVLDLRNRRTGRTILAR